MTKLQTLLLPVTAISMVFVMLIPVPSFVLDIVAGCFDYGFGDCVSDGGAGTAGGGLLRVSDAAAFADAVSVVAESGFEPENSAAWT